MEKVDVMEMVNPYLVRLKKCISLGWSDYWDLYRAVLHEHSKIARAVLIRDHIVGRVRREFDSDNSVRILEKKNGLFLLEICKKVLVRFKKFDSKKLSSNIPTKQSSMFLRQLTIPGFGKDRINLNAGYTPTYDWASIDGIFITHPNGINRISWFVDLGEMVPVQSVVEIFPSPEPAKERVRLKAVIDSDRKEGKKGADS